MPKTGEHPTDGTRAKMRRAAQVRQAIKRAKRNESPLRKIVHTEPGAYSRQLIATLECGHFKTCTHVGPPPKRTRCDACWQPIVETDKNVVSAIYAQILGCSEESPEEAKSEVAGWKQCPKCGRVVQLVLGNHSPSPDDFGVCRNSLAVVDGGLDVSGMDFRDVKYERDMLLMLILDGDEFGEGAFDRAVEKLKRATY